ncbi:hypothetical protein [Alicyclobacillus macrosporangiidus]|uniref:hypothetical protein n=1 Tax=Alicyclobacillus macrosporangiidus TaxID=392015 RepID=UPI0004978D47|nr:hypothetical protein [Alicyclobacillus macrosporangiidus]
MLIHRKWGIFFGTLSLFLLGVWAYQLIGVWAYQQATTKYSLPKPYVLPNDDFDQKTMNAIRAAIDQYRVATTPHDHEVYIVTGGLGEANPQLDGFDSDGNMTFHMFTQNNATIDIRETTFSPAKWQMQHQGTGIMVAEDPIGPVAGFSPVPWVHKTTTNGVDYYEWDEFPTTKVYYFQKDKTYVILTVNFEGQFAFPEGIINHLEPIGNPVS